MKEYHIVAVLWNDHIRFERAVLPKNPDKVFKPTLSVGILLDETDTSLVIGSDIERYDHHDEVTYTVILKATVESVKRYGTIKVNKPRR